jgi:hypothetical protein
VVYPTNRFDISSITEAFIQLSVIEDSIQIFTNVLVGVIFLVAYLTAEQVDALMENRSVSVKELILRIHYLC